MRRSHPFAAQALCGVGAPTNFECAFYPLSSMRRDAKKSETSGDVEYKRSFKGSNASFAAAASLYKWLWADSLEATCGRRVLTSRGATW